MHACMWNERNKEVIEKGKVRARDQTQGGGAVLFWGNGSLMVACWVG